MHFSYIYVYYTLISTYRFSENEAIHRRLAIVHIWRTKLIKKINLFNMLKIIICHDRVTTYCDVVRRLCVDVSMEVEIK